VLVLVARLSAPTTRRRELLLRAARPRSGTFARDLVVRRMPNSSPGRAPLRDPPAIVVTQSARHLTYSIILAFAICAVSVTVLTGWAGSSRSGNGVRRYRALTGAASRANHLNIGGERTGSSTGDPAVPLVMTIALASSRSRSSGDAPRAMAGGRRTLAIAGIVVLVVARACSRRDRHGDAQGVRSSSRCSSARSSCLLAVLVGRARTCQSLLLAISTMASHCGESYIFGGRSSPVRRARSRSRSCAPPRPVDLTHRNRAYYYFVLACLVLVLVVAGHIRRTGIGRMIIGVRRTSPRGRRSRLADASEAHRVRAGGFIAGLGGALLGGLVVTIGTRNASSPSRTRSTSWRSR